MSSMIATQHPLPSTTTDFWSMVHFSDPVAVVTLCASATKASGSDMKVSVRFTPSLELGIAEYFTLYSV